MLCFFLQTFWYWYIFWRHFFSVFFLIIEMKLTWGKNNFLKISKGSVEKYVTLFRDNGPLHANAFSIVSVLQLGHGRWYSSFCPPPLPRRCVFFEQLLMKISFVPPKEFRVIVFKTKKKIIFPQYKSFYSMNKIVLF